MIKGLIFFFIIIAIIMLVIGGQNTTTYVLPQNHNLVENDLNVQGSMYIDENIILKSPDNNTWICNVDNTGNFSCN